MTMQSTQVFNIGSRVSFSKGERKPLHSTQDCAAELSVTAMTLKNTIAASQNAPKPRRPATRTAQAYWDKAEVLRWWRSRHQSGAQKAL